MTPTPPEVVPAQVDREVVFAYWNHPAEHRIVPITAVSDDHPLVQAFARHGLATVEECARVIKDMAESARYREQIGSDDMQVEHGAAADALCEAYAAIRHLSAPPPPPVDVGEGEDG